MRRSVSTLAAVARDGTLSRVELAFFGFNMAETSTWIAILVYAYARGGASSAGIVAVILLLPAAAVAPLAAYASDRFRRDRVLVVEYLVQGVALAATAAALFADLHIAVLALAAVASAAFTFIRPTQGALLPAITRTPEDLTAANVVSGIVDGAARMIGPLIAGITLQVSEPATVFAIFAATSFVSAALVARLRVDAAGGAPRSRAAAPSVVRETLGGFRALRREHDARTIILLLAS